MQPTQQQARSEWMRSECSHKVISKLTLPMLPGIIALLAIDFIDSLLIANQDIDSLSALAYTIPITNILFGLMIGLSAAVVSLLSKAAASNNSDQARLISTNGLILGVLTSLIIALIGSLTLEATFTLLGVEPDRPYAPFEHWPNLMPQIKDYMLVRYWELPLWLIPMLSISIIRAIGFPLLAAFILSAWAIITILLDWVLVNGLLGFTQYGLQGIAYGHLIANTLFTLITLWLLKQKAQLLTWPRYITQSFKALSKIAIPASINNMIIPISLAMTTVYVAKTSPYAIAALGLITRIEPLLLLIPMALTTSLPVFSGQNWAVGQCRRVKNNLLYCFKFCFVFQGIIYLIIYMQAEKLAYSLSTNPYIIEWLVLFIKIVPASYGALAITMLAASTLNAINCPLRSLSISVIRVFLLHIPAVYIGHQINGVEGIFIGIVISNMITALIVLLIRPNRCA